MKHKLDGQTLGIPTYCHEIVRYSYVARQHLINNRWVLLIPQTEECVFKCVILLIYYFKLKNGVFFFINPRIYILSKWQYVHCFIVITFTTFVFINVYQIH